MSSLCTLASNVTSGGHFDLQMLVTKFCSLERSFMIIVFQIQKSLSREDEGVYPQATEGLLNVSLGNA